MKMDRELVQAKAAVFAFMDMAFNYPSLSPPLMGLYKDPTGTFYSSMITLNGVVQTQHGQIPRLYFNPVKRETIDDSVDYLAEQCRTSQFQIVTNLALTKDLFRKMPAQKVEVPIEISAQFPDVSDYYFLTHQDHTHQLAVSKTTDNLAKMLQGAIDMQSPEVISRLLADDISLINLSREMQG